MSEPHPSSEAVKPARQPLRDLKLSWAPPSQTVDDFGFPLVIELQPPPVPKDIQGPSPPIKAPPAS